MSLYVDFSSDKLSDVAPAIINFTSLCVGDVVSWLWDFGDGTTSYEENPSHTFIRGSYSITLTVYDGVETKSLTKYHFVDSYSLQTFNIDSLQKLQSIGSPGNAVSGEQGFALHDNYLQTEDINAAETILWNEGKGFLPIPVCPADDFAYNLFSGEFDGDNHVISDLYMNRSSTNNSGSGLFCSVNKATLKNINLINVNITGCDDVGAILGNQVQGSELLTIENCRVTGNIVAVLSQSAGCIVGEVSNIEMKNCYTNAFINGISNVGGCIGSVLGGTTLENCETHGDVYGNDISIGGLCGCIYNMSKVINCHTFGTVNSYSSCNIGGVCGISNLSDFEKCSSTGDIVSNGLNSGGFVGFADNNSNFSECFCLSNVAANKSGNVGGFVGKSNSNFLNCFCQGNIVFIYNFEVTGQVGGFAGEHNKQNAFENCYSCGKIESII